VVTVLDESFVVWVGAVGTTLDQSLQSYLGITEFPFFAVLGSTGDVTMTLLELIQGVKSADLFIANLFHVLEQHLPAITATHIQRTERADLVSLVEEQNREYAEALEADKAMVCNSQSSDRSR
jgi:hypothetical protein